MNPQDAVASTYDAIAPIWTHWADEVRPSLRERYVNMLVERLPPGSRVLEIGCGTGVPVAALLAHHFRLDGIDISREMVKHAQEAVPTGHFEVGDIAESEYGVAAFDGVVALHSLIHLPRDLQIMLFSRIFQWMRPAGLFIASLGCSDVTENLDENWLGTGPMYWSSYDAETTLANLEQFGFTIEQASVLSQEEPAGNEVTFLWLGARKPP